MKLVTASPSQILMTFKLS